MAGRGRARRRRIFRRLCLVLLAAILYVFWGNASIETDNAVYTSDALPAAFDGLRIAQLSDLHCKEFGADNPRLYAAVERAAPDLIFLTGDLVDEYAEEPVSYARTVGAALSAIAPTYFVTGNHEWAQGNAVAEAVKTALSESGVTVLSNEFVPLEQDGQTIFIAGIDDPNGYADQRSPADLAAEIYQNGADPFWLLLAHRNNLFESEYAALGADLTLSGHGHGGLWRLPFTDGLLGSGGTLLPSYTNGFYTCRGAEVFVSRGLGGMVRILNRPEVAVVILRRN